MILAPFWKEFKASHRLFVILAPVVGGRITKIKAGSGVPFIAGATLPSQVAQVIERY